MPDVYCIYKITNLINSKVYIGRTNNLKRRIKQHRNLSSNRYLSKSIKKYGWENFSVEILERNLNIENVPNIESKYIEEYNSTNRNFGYNIQKISQTGKLFCSDEEKIERSRSRIKKSTGLTLEEFQNKIVEMRDSGLTFQEISKELNVYVTTVTRHYHKAKNINLDDLKTKRIRGRLKQSKNMKYENSRSKIMKSTGLTLEEFHKQIKDLIGQGLSIYKISKVIGVQRETIQNHYDKYIENSI